MICALSPTVTHLTDDEQIVAGELVERHLQVQRRRSLADATGRIVMRTVARTVVATELAGIGNWYASQMRADANHDQPLGLLDTLLQNNGNGNQRLAMHNIVVVGPPYRILLRITQHTDGDRLLGGDLLAGAMADEQRLSAPLERDRFAFGNVGQLDLDLGQGQHIGGGAHRADELVHH